MPGIEVRDPKEVDWAKVSPEQIAEAKKLGIPVAFENAFGMKFVLIPSGKFLMGSPKTAKIYKGDVWELQREVAIPKAFYMSIHEVTQGQFREIAGQNFASHKKGDDHPMETVSWRWCAQWFFGLLSALDGRSYWFPRDAEWEYACRAGTTTLYCYGDDPKKLDDYGWHVGNSGRMHHPVGQKKPNNWGLYDMHGNVWEWCGERLRDARDDKSDFGGAVGGRKYVDDVYLGEGRVVRGGGFSYTAEQCRSANRYAESYRSWQDTVGVRVVLEINSFLPKQKDN